MRIRSKLLILMAVPILAVMFAAGLGFRTQNIAASNATRAQDSVQQSGLVNSALSAITLERLSEVGATGMDDGHELHEATDLALDDLAAFAAQSRNSELSEAVDSARQQISDGHLATTMSGSVDAYSSAYATILGVSSDLVDTLPTNDTLIQNLATDLVIAGTEEQSAAWFLYLSAPEAAQADSARIIQDFALSRQAFTHSRSIDSSMASTNFSTMNDLGTLETIALDDLAEGQLSVTSDEVLPELVAFSEAWTDTIAERDAVLAAAVADEVARVKNLQSLFTLLAIVGTVVLAGLVFVMYRSITDPLANLLDRANIVANEELPDLVETLRDPDGMENLPKLTLIEKQGDDEIGELIEAFNGMQGTAYQLAIEQSVGKRNVSDMFVNFGRRNQLLLQRMLTVITRLELDEEDPESLEGLFQLDNIVTRMRRNAESLLILAGAQTTRQWTAPVDISDTVRAAFGEVEAYERIDIVALTDVKVRGAAVSDISHLLAELLENALTFSESSTPVLVSGQFDTDGYLITIFDQGIGMNLEELGEANERISNPPALDRAPTRFLGLFVVGRLADRHGITARLVEAPGRGLMARIHLPRAILVTEDSTVEIDQAPIRSGSSESSPLETQQDIDTEWQGLSTTDLPERPTVQDEGGLPTRGVSASASDTAGSLETLPTRTVVEPAVDAGALADTAPVEAENLPVRALDAPSGQATVEAPVDPGRAAAVLPTRARVSDLGTIDEDSTSSIPAETSVEAVSTADPVEDETDGLPTRRRGESLVEDQAESSAAKTLDPDKSPGTATDFSSMMTALSSGISRGLDESTDDSDDEWSGK